MSMVATMARLYRFVKQPDKQGISIAQKSIYIVIWQNLTFVTATDPS
jgi:hypothetical protein